MPPVPGSLGARVFSVQPGGSPPVPVARARRRASRFLSHPPPPSPGSPPLPSTPPCLAVLLCVTSTPLAAQSPINIAALAPRTDSFVVMIQGNPLGLPRTIIERTETGLRMIDDVQIGPIMTQHTEVEFAPDGAMRSTKQTGQVRGQNTSIDIAYHDGRARGSATTPSMAGLVTTPIDTTVASGAIDDNLLTTVLPALEWSPTASITLPVFLSGKGY